MWLQSTWSHQENSNKRRKGHPHVVAYPEVVSISQLLANCSIIWHISLIFKFTTGQELRIHNHILEHMFFNLFHHWFSDILSEIQGLQSAEKFIFRSFFLKHEWYLAHVNHLVAIVEGCQVGGSVRDDFLWSILWSFIDLGTSLETESFLFRGRSRTTVAEKQAVWNLAVLP